MAKTESNKQQITVAFVIDKETKNTVRYLEVGEDFDHKIGALYVKKSTLRDMRSDAGAWPAGLSVVVTPVAISKA